jgi:tetratricopeptide (TPR) repeat protein
LFFENVHYGQDGPQLVISGTVSTSAGKKLGGVSVTLSRGGNSVGSASTASNGKYALNNMPMGHIYTLVISRDGYVTKEILIDAKTGYYAEDAIALTKIDLPFDLDEKKPDVDYSAVTNGFQIGKMAIDPAQGGLAIDSKFSAKQKSQYEKFFKDLEAKANKEEEDFKKLVTEGDNAIASGDFNTALNKYEEALKIKAGETTVTTKVADTKVKIETKKNFDKEVSAGDQALSSKNFDQAIAKYQAAKALLPNDKTIDAKIKDAETQKAANASAELDKKYNDKIAEAKKALADKDYGYAKSLYQEAGTLKPSEKEPPAKVIEIDKIIKDQLESDKKFAELVNAGNKSMLSEEYDNSIAKFEEALKIKKDAGVESELAKAKDLKSKKEAAENALKEKKAKFDAFIAAGDGKLGSKDFDAAINEFKSALALGVDNDKANAKIKSAEDAKKAAEDAAKANAEAQAAAEKKAKFDAFITAGDGKVGSKDFDAAINEFKSALALGVDNDKANAKIKSAEDAKKAAEDAAKANAEAQAAAEKKAKFDAFITAGDGKVGSKDFDAAINEFKSALALGVDNDKANAKIKSAEDAKKAAEDAAKANAEAQAAAEKKAKFDAFITAGDGKVGSKDFDAAINEFKSALALGVDNDKANAKIKSAEDAKKAAEDAAKANAEAQAAAEKKAKFDAFITAGDGKVGSKDFDAAINEFKSALALGVDNDKANAKIKSAEDAKKAAEDAAKANAEAQAAAEKKAKFDAFITAGDGKVGSKDFDAAINEFKSALALGVDNDKANAKIKSAEDAKKAAEDAAKANAEAQAAAEKKAKFDAFIAAGDGKLGSKDFDASIVEYNSALALEVDNPKANEKITAAKAAKKAHEDAMGAEAAAKVAAEKKAKFDAFIAAGDGKLGSKDFDASIVEYNSALALEVDNPKANEKITAAKAAKKAHEDAMGAEAAAKAAAEKKAKFDAFIAAGDGKLGSKDFDASIAEYNSALALEVDNPKANEKITAAKAAKKAHEDAMGAEAAAKVAAEKKAKFDAFIAAGDGKLGSKDFDASIAEYNSALALEVDNPKANEKITAAKAAKKAHEDAMGAEAAAKVAAEKKAKFDAFIAAGDGKLGSKDFDASIVEYNSALALEVDNPKANEKITAAKAAKKAHEDAMGAEAAAKVAAEKKAKFDAFIAAGDGKLGSKDFDASIAEYNSALALEVDNPKANEKITAAKAAKKAHEDAQNTNNAQAKLDAEFNKLIADGDAARDRKEWEKAKDFYGQANSKKPSDPLPQKKIDELKKLMDEQTLIEQQAQLQKYLEKGKEITEAGEFDKAIGLYNKAKGIFKGEPILDQRIEEVTQLKAKETEYNSFLASADGKFEKGDWVSAKTDYLKAKSVFDRPRPNEQIALIDKKLQEANNKDKEAEELAKKQAAYDALMQKGKSQKENKSYKEAIATYQSAKAILPNEKEPQTRIDEINKILADLDNNNALMQKYNAAIAKADAKRDEAKTAKSEGLVNEAKELYNAANKIKSDEGYPQTQIDALNDFLLILRKDSEDIAYQKIIDKADELFNADLLDKAEGLYKRAIELKPSDPYPPAQLKKIANARANAGKVDEFNNLVKEGNKLFGEDDYLKALSTFQKASGMKPEANYPKKKIDEINDILNKRKQEESAKNKKEEMALVDPNYRGERVMGVSELEADQWFKDAKLSYLEGNDAIIEQRKVDKLSFEDLEKEVQLARTEIGHSDLTKLVSYRSELENSWDNQRLENIPNVETYKGKQLEINNNKVERTTSSTYNDYESRVGMIAKFEQFSEDGDFRRREQTVVAVDSYKFKQENILEDRVQDFVNKTDKLNEYNTDMHLRIDNYNVDADIPRQENIVAVDSYKFKQENILEDRVQDFVNKTDKLNEYNTDMHLRIDNYNVDADIPRQENIVAVDSYKFKQENILEDRVQDFVNKTDKLNEYNTDMHLRIDNYNVDADIPRQENIVAVDSYKFKQENILEDRVQDFVNKTDKLNEYNTDMHLRIDNYNVDADIPRQEIVSAMEIYQERFLNNNKSKVETFTDKTLAHHEDKEKIKEAHSKLMDEDGKMREKNIDDVDQYKDKLLQEEGAKKESLSGAGFDKSLEYDVVKNQKATMFSDENVDPLTLQYPEGITEEMYQRKNNMGEVIEVTILRIVVNGNKADEYKKVSTRWTTNYFKNGGIITQHIWDTETH